MDTLSYGYRFLLMFAIIGVNGFFAGAEAALISSRASRLKGMAERNVVGASAALSLLARPERLLAVVQVGVTLTSLALGWVGEDTLYRLLAAWFSFSPAPVVAAVMDALAVGTAFVLMTYMHVVMGEVVPKNLAIGQAERFAVLVSPALLVFFKAAEPFVWVIEWSAKILSRAIGARGDEHAGVHSAEELKFVIAAAHSAGHVSEFEKDAASRLLELQEYAAREVMTPRNALTMVPVDAELDEVLKAFRESGFSRLPVYEKSREYILGIIHVKDVLAYWTERRQSNTKRKPVQAFDLRTILRKVPVVPETKPLNQLFDEMQVRRAQVAFVVDEFGTIAGLITMEDVLEQVFGEIQDEFDPVYQRPSLDAVSVEVEGTIPICDLDTQYGIELPDDHEFETLAGFMLFELGRIPKAGDEVEHEARRYTVLEMAHNRIAKVRIDRLEQAGDDGNQ
ncbi:MAG TPA: hemolysin family protein [Bryobacteraceae bacterium]|nr:hemolysin family protein [Bryobacteraceae bacterium]HPT24835.1 hemolysin family protein [Bryobacteraceae bacterium]